MIIRNEVLKTLKASPLNSRSVRRTCGQMATVESTLKGCPNSAVGRPIQGRCGALVISGGAAHHPAIERRRFQRLSTVHGLRPEEIREKYESEK